ncbi:MAG: 3-keto-5-aminohexanoate cleavage protein, partial [Eubacterium sp.]|nr:3-keto-5-aminohexanoate cleavage protein [Eubacterium sp.]
MDKRIISAALTGNWGDKSKNPALPMTPSEIADSAYEAWKAGAAVVHLHMRDEEGRPTMRVDLFEETMRLIKERCDVIINVTSSGGHSLDGMAEDETRMEPFRVLKPEMGSFDCGTMNWLHQTIFENSPQFLEKLGLLMQEVGTKPELEIFDIGMLDTAKYYLKKGILKAPCHFQFILGAPGGMAGTIANLVYVQSQIPEGSTWSASGLSKAHVPVLLAALAMGGHVRVGLEDNLYYTRGVLAESNAQL